MSPFDRVLAISQVMMLLAWEAIGVVAFDWNPLVILAVWFVALWSFNILTATAVRTFFKLTHPGFEVAEPVITEDDEVG